MQTLAAKRVLVTRAAEDALELEELLRGRGAVPVRFPCIAFEDGPDFDRIRQAIAESPDFVVVSSPHAAKRLLELKPGAVRFAAVGEATARHLPGEVVVPRRGAGADALLEVLAPLAKGKRVLVPRAEQGTPALVEGLTKAGAQVEVRILYRTITPKTADTSVLRDLDAISFASGSAVRGFVALAGLPQAPVACIGASTAAEAKKAGIRVDAYADGGLPELCDALALAVRARKG